MGEEIKFSPRSDLQDQTVRSYLLGMLKDEQLMHEIEANILTNDEFSDELHVAEDCLIEEYIDGTLSESERSGFEQMLRTSSELRERTKLISALKTVAAKRSAERELSATRVNPNSGGWLSIFRTPRFAWVGAALLIFIFGGILWIAFRDKAAGSESLDQYIASYKGTRATASRSAFDIPHQDHVVTRGSSLKATDEVRFARAKAEAEKALAASPNDVEALRTRALIALAEMRFDAAIYDLQKALGSAPGDPHVLNDLGSALYERAARAPNADRETDLVSSLSFLNKALQIEPNSSSAAFNKALVLEQMGDRKGAIEAWTKYLTIDPGSKWSAEAARRREVLLSVSN